jgi:hypothetical protein
MLDARRNKQHFRLTRGARITPFHRATSQPARYALRALTLAALLVGPAIPAHAWGRGIRLARKFQPGQTMVYQTTMETHATVSSTPPGMSSFLPPLPTEVRTRQQNTVTVRAVHPDGSADVETHFDQFQFESNILDAMPPEARDSISEAQQEFSRRLSGQTLTAHYTREGQLLGFDGADDVLQQLDAPLREALRQILRLFLDQMGGNALYPDQLVRPGEEWKRALAAQPSAQSPFAVEGENTLRYVGRTRYAGVKAAVLDFHYSNVLKPTLESLRGTTPLVQLKAHGISLDLRIEGQGHGRVLLAVADGRILQDRPGTHQTLIAHLSVSRGSWLVSEPVTLKIDSDTTLEVNGTGK